MKANEWVKLIRDEFGVSRKVANSMYYIMTLYYEAIKPIKEVIDD